MPQNLITIQTILNANADQAALDATRKFVPGAEKIYGVRTPLLSNLAKQYKAGGFNLVKELWQSGAFEEKILAAKLLGIIANKDAVQSLKLIELFAEDITNWAVCDTVGMQALQPIRKTHKEEIFTIAKKYNVSSNLWKRRLSLVLTEWYTRDPSLHSEISKLVNALENDEAYYVRKAVVWIKRNMAKGR